MTETIVCSNCGTENADEARFCNQCGSAFDVPAAAAAERRQVSPSKVSIN